MSRREESIMRNYINISNDFSVFLLQMVENRRFERLHILTSAVGPKGVIKADKKLRREEERRKDPVE